MKLIEMMFRTTTMMIAIVAIAICSLNAQELRKTNMQWKGKAINVAEERMVIKVRKNISKVTLTNKTQLLGFEIIDGPDDMCLAFVRIPKGKSIQEAIDIAKSLVEIEGAEPVVATHTSVVPNDQYYSNQWGLPKINATSCWDITKGNSSIILGGLDSGIPMQNNSLSHPDLQNSSRILLGNDYTGDGQSVRDRNGHGTHVIGIASGETNNSTGVSGVGWNTKVFVIQVFDSLGSGYDYYFYQGVQNAVSNGAKVINFSGGQMAPSYYAEAAVQYAQSHGVLVVVSAGNYDAEDNPNRIVEWPAAYSLTYDNVIAVSATNSSDVIASFSSRGSAVNVAAPGDWVYSTLPNYPNYKGTQNYYYLSGTSMAAPHVSGTAALLLSLYPTLTPSQMRTIIQQSAEDKGTTGFDTLYGYGRINAFKALKKALETYGGTLTQNITIPGDTWNFQTAITVASGVTLNVQQTTTLAFPSGVTLTVNGTLNANSVAFDRIGSSGQWNGIVFNSGSSGSIEYSTVKNATTGITCNNVLPSIRYNTIKDNGTGIKLNNVNATNPSIYFNYISNNSNGVYCSYSSPYIEANEIFQNSTGIFCYNSAPWIFKTTAGGNNSKINSNTTGIYLIYYSPANIRIPGGSGLNAIYNNNLGVYADYQCNAFISGNDFWVNNTYNVRAKYPCVVQAQYNWWGGYPPNPNKFYATDGAQIFPYPGSSNPYTQLPLSKQSNPPLSSEQTERTSFFNSVLSEAGKLQIEGKYKGAIDQYKKEYKNDENQDKRRYILAQLAECYRLDKRDDFIEFLNQDIRKSLSQNDDLFATTLEVENLFLIKDGKYESAIENFNFILTNFQKNSVLVKNALFGLGTIHTDFLKDNEKGRKYFNELKTKFPDDILTWQSKLILREINNIPSQAFLNNENPSEVEQPASSGLISSYPNPFNPTSVISYKLSMVSNVSLKVYDILGRDVATLIDGIKEAGYHSISFDGSRLSSGIYFVRLIINSSDSRTQIKTMKVLLAK